MGRWNETLYWFTLHCGEAAGERSSTGQKARLAGEPTKVGAVKYCMHSQYDPIEYAEQLEAAGVPKAQANAHAHALGQVLNRCLDAGAETKLRAEMQVMESKILSRFETLESSLRSEMNFLKWMNGLTLALVVGLYVRSWLG